MKGLTIDFWAYVPRVFSDMDDNHRYRLAFANENSGPVASNYRCRQLLNPKRDEEMGLTGGGTRLRVEL